MASYERRLAEILVFFFSLFLFHPLEMIDGSGRKGYLALLPLYDEERVTLESRHAWKTDFVSGVMQNGRDTYLHQESIDVKDRGVPDDSIGLTSCKAV